ncbi:MAG: hypothetical protein HWE26_14595 [Alteromonadaceae bacterium]|nr:hypothetical protein [Alteromonadaceae bacterium]
MSKPLQMKSKIKLDDTLIDSAKGYLDRQPKSPEEVIEYWARIGMAAAEQLTEEELMKLQLRNNEVSITVVPKT